MTCFRSCRMQAAVGGAGSGCASPRRRAEGARGRCGSRRHRLLARRREVELRARGRPLEALLRPRRRPALRVDHLAGAACERVQRRGTAGDRRARRARTRSVSGAGTTAPMSARIPRTRDFCGRCVSNLFGTGEPRTYAYLHAAPGGAGSPQPGRRRARPAHQVGRPAGARLRASRSRSLPFFNLVLVYNPGAAFSFLASAAAGSASFFIAIAVAASVLIVYLLRTPRRNRLVLPRPRADARRRARQSHRPRDRLGAVIDFIDVHAAGYHWPAFNVADSRHHRAARRC